jgi:hypothetical protein
VQVDQRLGPAKTYFWEGLRTRVKYGMSMICAFHNYILCCRKGTEHWEINSLGFERAF